MLEKCTGLKFLRKIRMRWPSYMSRQWMRISQQGRQKRWKLIRVHGVVSSRRASLRLTYPRVLSRAALGCRKKQYPSSVVSMVTLGSHAEIWSQTQWSSQRLILKSYRKTMTKSRTTWLSRGISGPKKAKIETITTICITRASMVPTCRTMRIWRAQRALVGSRTEQSQIIIWESYSMIPIWVKVTDWARLGCGLSRLRERQEWKKKSCGSTVRKTRITTMITTS